MKKALVFLPALVLLIACSSDEPPPVKYTTAPTSTITLDVAKVTVVDHSNFQPSTSPYNTHNNLTPKISEALRQWLETNVRAGGSRGEALIVIKDASLSGEKLPMSQDTMDQWFKRQQASRYTGHAEVSVEIQGRDGYGLASAEASHSVTLPETPTDTERQNDYMLLLGSLMKEVQKNFDASVHEHMQQYVLVN